VELIKNYLLSIKMVEATGRALGEKLVELLKPLVKDLSFTLGWNESGTDTICFFSRTHQRGSLKNGDEFLETVIEEVFPELKLHVDTPFCVYLRSDEIQGAKRILEEWRAQENRKKEDAIKWAKKQIEEMK